MERREFLIKTSLLTAGIGIGIVGCSKEKVTAYSDYRKMLEDKELEAV